ncbi:sodium:solute symporter family protein [Erythrobacter aureus]|uniref:Na+:solute symporter n=1 Tax=Erythrobacter aureus TaxID=2182384 RepID=A0A345YH95_9SPHN|nr:sodium:solute symporter family protein [Erythrobacter aureus]AXK43297.1 Na+:solute symporter [Erythrobacter aureus]
MKQIDWLLVCLFPALSLLIGLLVSKRAGESSESYFLSGRNMPWWLLGASLVATTFAADTPNLVTEMVRTGGVSKNWLWWAFLPSGVLTAFVYAKLWRRSRILTDLEFYTLRYSPKMGGILRTFRALYLGVLFNVLTMAAVTLAAIKIGAVMVGAEPWQVILTMGVATMLFSTAGGFLGVVVADLVLFVVAMGGAIAAAWFVLDMPQIGGLAGLASHPAVAPNLSILPDFADWEVAVAIFIVPLAVQWWSVWYPGSEPGGGGYVAQRMLAAKDEKHSVGAVLFFQFAHYAVRPWPWIIVALASLILYPDLDSIERAFPDVAPSVIGHDLAYSAMLTHLPSGILGLVVASLAAAYMSTIATQLNWGASYVVNDFWVRHVNPEASDAEQVRVGRFATVALMVMAGVLALFLSNALQAFQILLAVGAGTGLLFLLRWFWWRINAQAELAAMIISFGVAVMMAFLAPDDWSDSFRLVASVAITTVGWLAVTFLTKPTDNQVLYDFVKRIDPPGPGWRKIRESAVREGVDLPTSPNRFLARGLACVPAALALIYASLFGIGALLFGQVGAALIYFAVAAIGGFVIWRLWPGLFEPEALLHEFSGKEKG